MRGQEEEGFKERCDERGNNGCGKHPNELSDIPLYEEKREERHHGGGDRRHDRPRHLGDAENRGLERLLSAFPRVRDLLSYDDRIVDHDSQGHYEAEKGNQVYGLTGKRHDHESAGEGDRNPQRHPEGKAKAEKKKKGDEDPVVITQAGSVYAMAKFGAL